MPQSPTPKNPVPIGYIRQVGDHPRPASRVDVEPANAGIAGAKMANDENNAGGRFTGEFYSLDVALSPRPTRLPRLKKFLDSGHHYIVVDASGRDAAQAVRLGQGQGHSVLQYPRYRRVAAAGNCRANIMHVAPDRYMLADALAQYLVVKKWTNWLLVYGSTPGDLAYAEAIKRAAVAVRRQYRRRARI